MERHGSLQQKLCCLCTFESPTIVCLLSHLRLVHSNDPRFAVCCGINSCTVTFKSFSSLYSHVYRNHRDAGIRKRNTPNDSIQSIVSTSEPTNQAHGLLGNIMLDSTGTNLWYINSPPPPAYTIPLHHFLTSIALLKNNSQITAIFPLTYLQLVLT